MTMTAISEIDLADLYGNAGLDIDRDRFEGRHAAVNAVTENADVETIIGLVGIVFGLCNDAVTNRIVAAVREDDQSFSAKAHAREIRILAVRGLEILTVDGLSAGLHAVLAMSICGQRTCDVDHQIVSRMEGRRRSLAVLHANFVPNTTIKSGPIKIDNLKEKIDAVVSFTPSGGQQVAAPLQDLFETFIKAIDNKRDTVTRSTQGRLYALITKIEHQQNELDLLWWLIGRWSTLLEAPLDAFELPARGLLIGADLGLLSNLKGSPAAVAAIAERAIGSTEDAEQGISFKQIIGALSFQNLGNLSLEKFDLTDRTAFPVLSTLKLRYDRTVEAEEVSLYNGLNALDSDEKHSILQWIEHIYHEMILARLLYDEHHEHD